MNMEKIFILVKNTTDTYDRHVLNGSDSHYTSVAMSSDKEAILRVMEEAKSNKGMFEDVDYDIFEVSLKDLQNGNIVWID